MADVAKYHPGEHPYDEEKRCRSRPVRHSEPNAEHIGPGDEGEEAELAAGVHEVAAHVLARNLIRRTRLSTRITEWETAQTTRSAAESAWKPSSSSPTEMIPLDMVRAKYPGVRVCTASAACEPKELGAWAAVVMAPSLGGVPHA